MKKKLIISTVAFVIFFTLFKIFSSGNYPDFFANNGCHTLTERMRAARFCGIVDEKYLDKKSHMDETIIVNNKKSEIMMIIPNELSGLYEFIEVGDSIFKEKESMECYIKRESITKRFEIDFGCK